MEFTKKYTSLENIENYLNVSISVEAEATVEQWIISMSEYIKNYTNRDWLADEIASRRLYNGNNYQSIEIEDFIGIETVEIGNDFDEDMVEVSRYTVFPFNSTSKNTVILKDDIFPIGTANVAITAKFGYLEATPRDIEFATTVLVAGVIQAQTTQDGEIESERIGNYTVKYTTNEQKKDYVNAMQILDNRRVIRI